MSRPWEDLIHAAGLDGRTKMIRRAEVQPGDEVLSSHYGRRRVERVRHHGSQGQTTEIVFESPLAGHVQNERYGSDRMIPKVMPDAWIVTTLHSHCPPCNEQIPAAISHAGVTGSRGCTYNVVGDDGIEHGAKVERETYAERRVALGLS